MDERDSVRENLNGNCRDGDSRTATTRIRGGEAHLWPSLLEAASPNVASATASAAAASAVAAASAARQMARRRSRRSSLRRGTWQDGRVGEGASSGPTAVLTTAAGGRARLMVRTGRVAAGAAAMTPPVRTAPPAVCTHRIRGSAETCMGEGPQARRRFREVEGTVASGI
jgi:hypothetical protein